MRLVCRSWCKLLRNPDFTKAHLSKSINKSLMKVVDFDRYFEVYSMDKDRTLWKPLRRFEQEYLAHGDGLILSRDYYSSLYVINPITSQILRLPHAPPNYSNFHRFAVAYSPSISKYKVFCIDFHCKRAYILTVGVDKDWRELLMEPDILTTLVFDYRPKYDFPQGVWGKMYRHFICRNSIIVLDLEDETFYKVDFLEKFEGSRSEYISIRSYRIPYIVTDQDYRCWVFWELVDHKNGGEWRKIGTFDFETECRKLNEITGLEVDPKSRDVGIYVSGLNGSDEVVFQYRDYKHFFAYNFKTGIISWLFNKDTTPKTLELMLTKSLVAL